MSRMIDKMRAKQQYQSHCPRGQIGQIPSPRDLETHIGYEQIVAAQADLQAKLQRESQEDAKAVQEVPDQGVHAIQRVYDDGTHEIWANNTCGHQTKIDEKDPYLAAKSHKEQNRACFECRNAKNKADMEAAGQRKIAKEKPNLLPPEFAVGYTFEMYHKGVREWEGRLTKDDTEAFDPDREVGRAQATSFRRLLDALNELVRKDATT